MRRQALVHIGTEKTGSTALQGFLSDNRQRLLAEGVFFPQSFGRSNHTALVVASQDDDARDNIKAHALARSGLDIGSFRDRVRKSFDEESRRAGDWNTLFVSSELIHSRLHTPSEIDRLLSFIRDTVDEITVVAVLRRQDKLAVSRMSSAIRAGHSDFERVFGDISDHYFHALPAGRVVDDLADYYDYNRLLNRFAEVLGEDALRVFLFEDSGKRSDSVRMIGALACPGLSDHDMPTRDVNQSMSVEAQFVITALNRRFSPAGPDGRRNEDFVALKRLIEARLAGTPRQVARATAQEFASRFEASNEEVRRRFFPERAELFDTDFSMYPESVDYTDLPERLEREIETYAARLQRAMSRGPASRLATRLIRSARKRLRRWAA